MNKAAICCISVLALNLLAESPVQAQSVWRWDNPMWCIAAVNNRAPYTLTNYVNVLNTLHLPPDEAYGEEVRMRMLIMSSDQRQIEVFCSLMDLSELDEPGSFQVETYIPSIHPNRWIQFTLNHTGQGSQNWVEPLPENWID